MSTTERFRSESTISERNMPRLDVLAMIKPILHNYDSHVNNFIFFLRTLGIHLVYSGTGDVRDHILHKTLYACSLQCPNKKILKDLFPIMIGSRLDLAIRHAGLRSFPEPFDLANRPAHLPFQKLDIARGFFLINGLVRQLPYLYTSDPTNTHVIQKKSVRVYAYNAQDRGKELNYYIQGSEEHSYGDVEIVDTDGKKMSDYPRFFSHCPHPVDLKAYMDHVFREDDFDIDHLGNKMVVSPGHMFTKLIIKYLYMPLKTGNWALVKSKAAQIANSIETGFLLDVLSRKTVYFKERVSAGKMTNEPKQSHREIGSNGEVFIEKNMGCYREVLTQTYPLNPFLLYMIVRQTSKKVKHSSIDAFHPSYENFFCMLGVFETKNIGRTTMMVRDTLVTTCNDLDPVYHRGFNEPFWNCLRLEPRPGSGYYVVVNEACIPVTRECFHGIDLLRVKNAFRTIECYQRKNFIVLRYKTGILMKKLPDSDIWVSPYDMKYWTERTAAIAPVGFSYMTSYHIDFNYFFNHTAFPKDILAFNALKNAILATDPKYAFYFMDTVSAYFRKPSRHHKVLMEPVDEISKHFLLSIPHVMLTYMSFQGCTQEDCIVKRRDFTGFDCCRFYTLRFHFEFLEHDDDEYSWVKFYPVHGDVDRDSPTVGTLVAGEPISLVSSSISTHVRIESVSPREHRIRFMKQPFRVLSHVLAGKKLIVCLEQEHVSSTGDKLCSLHGQKGVIRVMEKVPTLDRNVKPDIIVNPYCLFRMTPGQMLEAIALGEGKDSVRVQNSSGVTIPGGRAFYGKTFYFPVAYWAFEHLYAPEVCVSDRVMSQPVKGRSRGGGMKLGNMEVNAMRGNGIANCFEEKFFEDGDRVQQEDDPTLALPKSVNLVTEDAKFYKCHLQYETEPSIVLEESRGDAIGDDAVGKSE